MADTITRQSIVRCLRIIDLDQTNPTKGGSSVFTGWGGTHDLAGTILLIHGYSLPSTWHPLNFCAVTTLLKTSMHSFTIEPDALGVLVDLQVLSDDGNKWADVVALVIGDLESV